MGVIYKIKPEVKNWIIEKKRTAPALSCRGLVSLFENEFNLKISKSSINYIIKNSHKFDLIHSHDGLLSLSFANYFKCPLVGTFHTSVGKSMGWDMGNTRAKIFKRSKIISLSYAQRREMPEAKFIGNVYNGTVDFTRYDLGKGGDYLVWIGRFNPYKGAKEAIEVARKSGYKIILAGKIEPEEQAYFDKYIKVEIDQKKVIYIGEIGLEKKNELLGGAKALLMPISWEEPFGLVMIEAMACGTPVIAFDRGSVREVVLDDKTGFIVKPGDIDGMAMAVKKIDRIERKTCREHVKENFSIEKMVLGYEQIYSKIIKNKKV